LIGGLIQEGVPLHYVRNDKNQGAGFSRNRGWGLAAGDFVCFLDSDDRWLPEKLARKIDVMVRNPGIDILFTDFVNIDELENVRLRCFDLSRDAMAMLEVSNLDRAWQIEGHLVEALLKKMFIQIGTVVVRKGVLEKTGGFDNALSGPEDFEFCLRAALFGCRFAYIDEITQERYKNATSLTASGAISWWKTRTALEMFRKLCDEKGRADLIEPIDRSIQRANRNTILKFGRENRRGDAGKAYLHALRTGDLSFKTMAAYLLAVAGLWPFKRTAIDRSDPRADF
jgi:glycosyltransferase involved in cell wall biosynthesis